MSTCVGISLNCFLCEFVPNCVRLDQIISHAENAYGIATVTMSVILLHASEFTLIF